MYIVPNVFSKDKRPPLLFFFAINKRVLSMEKGLIIMFPPFCLSHPRPEVLSRWIMNYNWRRVKLSGHGRLMRVNMEIQLVGMDETFR